MEIEKTNRMNALFEFYSTLLTIKRTEKILEDYEKKLHMFSDYMMREDLLEQLSEYTKTHYPKDETLRSLIEEIQEIEE